MISCQHRMLDDRIYKKEALTLSRAGYTVIHIGYGDCFKDYITEDHIRIIQLKKNKKGTTLRSKFSAFRQTMLTDLYNVAKNVSADVYHLHDVELCRIAGKLKKLPFHPKIIYDAHEPFCDNLKDYWRERSVMKVIFIDIPAVLSEKQVLKKADHLIATEENVASRFRKKNPSTSVIYNYSYFYPKFSSYNSKIKEYDAIYCGSISESKGIFLIIDALIHCKKKGYEYKLVIVGDYNHPLLKSRIDAIIKTEKLEHNLFFTGKLPLEDVSGYYSKSKIGLCLFPKNRTNQLILPIKLFEYPAFGLPIIGSNFGHIKNIIQLNKIGIMVDPHNPKEVASALIKLIEGDNYKKYTQICINCVKNNYLWESQKAKLVHIYEDLLKDNGKQ